MRAQLTDTIAAAAPAPARAAVSKPELRAAPDLLRFGALVLQLGLVIAVFRLFHLEDYRFQRMIYVVFGGFLAHYWLPFRWKEPFLALLSLGGAFYLLGPAVAGALVGAGAALFVLLHIPVAFRLRVAAVAAVFALLIYGASTHRLPIPSDFYAIFGGIFMFRIMIYAYDLSHSRKQVPWRQRLLPFLNYFYILPNYCFLFFPVIDFQTMRQTYYQRDVHRIAQQGIQWMARGTIQLMLYRLVVYFNDPFIPDRVNSLGALVTTMILTYLLYLNISGHFHLVVGMLHLFGFDLPETNRKYLLASSLTDFWRRINIYWKDFMVKMFYFPVYFKLRKKGELRAQSLAIGVVFLATWAFHVYQSFWLIGEWTFSWIDTVFWTILGASVLATMLWEERNKRQKKAPAKKPLLLRSAQTLATFSYIVFLWFMWNQASFGSWRYLMTHWMGAR